MIRVAMLGADSTHVEAYAGLANRPAGRFFGQAKIEWLWGADPHQAKQKAKLYRIPVVARTPKEAVKEADLVMVSPRFGEDHYRLATIAIDHGKPTYIDKPMTNSLKEAQAILTHASRSNVPVMSFSALRFATELLAFRRTSAATRAQGLVVTGPLDSKLVKDRRAANIYYYGIHAVEILQSLTTGKAISVFADRSQRGIWALVTYQNGVHGVLNLSWGVKERYHVTIYGRHRMQAFEIDPYGSFYEAALRVILQDLLKGKTNNAPLSEAVSAIQILDAIERSIQDKRVVEFK